MRLKTFIACLFFAALPLYADNLYTITIRGLNKDFPLIAWQMTYRVTAAAQAEAETLAMERARQDGCEAASAHIVSVTVTVPPENSRPAAAVIIVAPPTQTPEPEPPRIEYEEAYQAGYDHGITGYITGKGAVILNHEIPEKYRLAEQEQAYKNGYAKGFFDEKAKAQRRPRPPSPPPGRTNGNNYR
jgi:hypothetical protein